MEPRPREAMPPNPLQPLVRAVVFTALYDFSTCPYCEGNIRALSGQIAGRLCEAISQDGWDYSDRVRRAATKATWGIGDDDYPESTEISE